MDIEDNIVTPLQRIKLRGTHGLISRSPFLNRERVFMFFYDATMAQQFRSKSLVTQDSITSFALG